MDVGIGLPTTIPGTEGRTLVEWARRAEEAGFSTLGTIGRLVYPNYDELIALAAAAAVTERIRLTTSILIAPLHANTALLAKQTASLDRLSGGRLVLAVGLGGRDDDYVASGLPTTGRGRRLEERLEELKRIWTSSRSRCSPKPSSDQGRLDQNKIRRADQRFDDQSLGSRLFRKVSGGGAPHRCGGTSHSRATQRSSIWSMSENHSIQEPHGSGL